jgi:hypothetical protein
MSRVGIILWGYLKGQNPKPYLCFGHLCSDTHECYELVDLEFNVRMTFAARDINRFIDEGDAWWDDQGRRSLQPR